MTTHLTKQAKNELSNRILEAINALESTDNSVVGQLGIEFQNNLSDVVERLNFLSRQVDNTAIALGSID